MHRKYNKSTMEKSSSGREDHAAIQVRQQTLMSFMRKLHSIPDLPWNPRHINIREESVHGKLTIDSSSSSCCGATIFQYLYFGLLTKNIHNS
jgi:hypothetical protein